MKKHMGYLLIVPVLLMALVPAASAGDSAVSTMAGIVMHLNHYPADGEKRVLAGIVNDKRSTSGEKVLAGALMRVQHQVGGSDAKRLRELTANDLASRQERDLAGILLGLAHHPSKADKKRLKLLLE